MIGKSGIGKSSLINASLKEKLAEVRGGKACTLNPAIYNNKKISFLRMVDTRGIELIKKYGIENLFKNIEEIFNNPKKISNSFNPFDFFKCLSYKDNIQCIWYCISEDDINPSEVKFIRDLAKGQDILPIIFVYTKSTNQEDIDEKEKILKKTFPNIPFHSVLAYDKDEVESFGLEELVYLTINVCKSAFKGKLFDGIKNEIKTDAINYFEKENEKIMLEVNKKVALHFIKTYDIVLEDNKFKKYIYDLLEMMVLGFLENKENQQIHNESDSIEKYFNSFLSENIDTFINYYKKEANQLIAPVLYKKAINYLNVQAILEKSKNINLKVDDKCNKKEFESIIENNLRNNFYYMAQKYFIYQLINEFCDSFSEKVAQKDNEVVKTILNETEIYYFYKDIYRQKFMNLEKKIRKCYINKEYEKMGNTFENENNANKIFQLGCNLI